MAFNKKLALKLGLSKKEIFIIRRFNTPEKLQDFIVSLKANLEKHGETLMSPRLVLQTKSCHCIEGALLSALVFYLHGKKPLIVDMRAKRNDLDHCIAPFKVNGFWGAISKTNHAIIRYRDPVYKTLRELMMSYYHEYYIIKNGEKSLRSYSAPFNLKKLKDSSWVTSSRPLWHIDKILDKQPHKLFVLNKKIKARPADKFERKVAAKSEYC